MKSPLAPSKARRRFMHCDPAVQIVEAAGTACTRRVVRLATGLTIEGFTVPWMRAVPFDVAAIFAAERISVRRRDRRSSKLIR